MAKRKTKQRKLQDKQELEELKKAYKRYCTFRSFIIGFLYTWEELSKNWGYIAIGLMGLGMYVPKIFFKIATPLAIIGSICALIAKLYQLKHMKFRKRGFYEKGEK